MSDGNPERRTKGSDLASSARQDPLDAAMQLTGFTRSRHLEPYQRDALLSWLRFTKGTSEVAGRLAPDEASRNRTADVCAALLAVDEDIMDDIENDRDPVPGLVVLLNCVSQALHSPPVSIFPLLRLADVVFREVKNEMRRHNSRVRMSRDRNWEAHHGERSRERPDSFANELTLRYLDQASFWPLSDALAEALSRLPFFRRVLLSNGVISQDSDEKELLRLARALTELMLMQQDMG